MPSILLHFFVVAAWIALEAVCILKLKQKPAKQRFIETNRDPWMASNTAPELVIVGASGRGKDMSCWSKYQAGKWKILIS